jgi:methionyl-tRNA formyltransferase
LGCVNLLGSIIPKYRGAAPVHWAVANGESTTGVCTMLLDEGLDTGPVYLCEETPVGPDETAPELYNRLAVLGAPLLARTIDGIVNGTLNAQPQESAQATYAPPLNKEDGFINWAKPAAEIHNRVRALNPWPGTVTRFRDSICKILKTRQGRMVPLPPVPGSIAVSKGTISVVCGDGKPLEILTIQPENRKAISGADFANGARIQPDEKFESMMDN